jgi:hypothetical protein
MRDVCHSRREDLGAIINVKASMLRRLVEELAILEGFRSTTREWQRNKKKALGASLQRRKG